MGKDKPRVEVLRSSFDIEGERVEFLFDQNRNRYTVATRWANLVHFSVGYGAVKKRVAHERASAVFECVCMHGATETHAKAAKRAALGSTPSRCAGPAGFEREVIRRTSVHIEGQSCE